MALLDEKQISDIRALYNAPGRTHYNASYLDRLLDQFQPLRPFLSNPDAVELAIYYQDIVSDPIANDNEFESMAQMVADLAGVIDGWTLRTAAVLIEAKAEQDIPSDLAEDLTIDCAYFLDIEQSFLGADQSDFDEYECTLRTEYSFLPDADYRTARAEFIMDALTQDRLFFTDYFSRRYEIRARQNLMRHLTISI
jgi:predicted metal-dependent HD superfamily phosphohydrolase